MRKQVHSSHKLGRLYLKHSIKKTPISLKACESVVKTNQNFKVQLPTISPLLRSRIKATMVHGADCIKPLTGPHNWIQLRGLFVGFFSHFLWKPRLVIGHLCLIRCTYYLCSKKDTPKCKLYYWLLLKQQKIWKQ